MGITAHKIGRSLPQDPQMIQRWLDKLIKTVDPKQDRDLKPELKKFQELIEKDVTLKVLSSLMLNEVPTKPPYNKDPNLEPQVRGYQHMLQLLDHITDSAPKWSQIADQIGIIGFPISAVLEWPMNTSSGNAFFLRKDVNEQWAKVLGSWAEYLNSAESASVLTDDPDGWFNESAVIELTRKGNNGVSDYTFEQLYICDQAASHHGYTSWDHFFTRKFREGTRPITIGNLENLIAKAASGIGSSISLPNGILENAPVIYNACESCPVFLRRGDDVLKSAQFWLKDQPYSLSDMLVYDELTDQFTAGTVYQAFLSALSYHRWHSPVSGTVVKAFNVPGSYYSVNYYKGFADTDDGPDQAGPDNSQAYITSVAARAVIIIIKADSPAIGEIGFVAVGMCEVSSNEITVSEGQRVMAGDQIGMFHFGGSTHCLLFRKGVDMVFGIEPNNGSSHDPPPKHNLPLRSGIAMVKTG